MQADGATKLKPLVCPTFSNTPHTFQHLFIARHGIRGIVIDPYNELDHSRPSYMSETEYVSKMLSQVRCVASCCLGLLGSTFRPLGQGVSSGSRMLSQVRFLASAAQGCCFGSEQANM